MQCVGRVEISLSCWLRQTGGNSRYLLRLELTIGLDAGRGSQGAGQLGKYKIEDTRFMTTKLFTKPLDDPNGSIKVTHNDAMQLASQTKKTPWHLRFAPGAILRQIGLAVLALTMLVGLQTPSVNAQISWEATSWPSFVGTGTNRYSVISGRVNGIETSWTLTRIRLSRLVDTGFLAKIRSINETLGDDLGRALKKYMGDIDWMTASAQRRAANCLIQNANVKFPDCTLSALSTWEVHILFAIEELEASVNSAVRRANSSASALVSSYNN